MAKHPAIKHKITGEIIICAGRYGESLRGADLRDADPRGADLREADLRWANLQGADLRGANLRGADLQRADLDFSCWPLWCGSLNVTVSMRHVYQLAYHLCSLKCDTKTYREMRKMLAPYANKFHRAGNDVPEIKVRKGE